MAALVNLNTEKEKRKVRACHECRHVIGPWSDLHCGVQGLPTEVERNEVGPNACGPDAKWWEPKRRKRWWHFLFGSKGAQ